MHPVFRFWWGLSPNCSRRIEKIDVPGYVSLPPHAIGNGSANCLIGIIKMMDPIIIKSLYRGDRCLEVIFVEYGNPDDGTANFGAGVFVKNIFMYRTGTLVTSQWTCG